MNNGYERALQYQLFSCAYPHGKRVMPLACECVITCRVREFTLFPEILWRVTIILLMDNYKSIRPKSGGSSLGEVVLREVQIIGLLLGKFWCFE